MIRPLFDAASGGEPRDRLSAAVAELEGRSQKDATMLEPAEEDVLPFYALPAEHSTKLSSTNALRT